MRDCLFAGKRAPLRASRWFLRARAAVAVWVFACGFSESAVELAAEEAVRRPNVVWIVSDDHAAYVSGCYGNRLVRTPHLDRLAARGVLFERAYANSPVCTASRAALITGRYPRSVGVTQLATPLPDEALTLTEVLAEAGYRTACWGKTHYNSSLKHGFEILQGTAEHNAWLRAKPRRPLPDGVAVLGPWQPFRTPARQWLNADCLPFGSWDDEMADTYFAQQAAQFIAEAAETPFFAMVSLTATHSPFRFPVEFYDRVAPKSVPLHRAGAEDEWQIPEAFRDLSESDYRGISAAHYTAAEFLDKNVGVVMQAVADSVRADSTIIVYASDHGYMLGQHGRFEKHCSYEPAVRTPLIIQGPAVQPHRATRSLVELIDVAPTIVELCGVPVPPQMQGRSLAAVLRGETDRHRDEVVVEYAPNEEIMICDGRWKLVYFRGRRERTDGYRTGRSLEGPKLLLFDLRSDPQEMSNLSGNSDSQPHLDRLLRRLADHLVRTARDPAPLAALRDPLEVLELAVQPPEGH